MLCSSGTLTTKTIIPKSSALTPPGAAPTGSAIWTPPWVTCNTNVDTSSNRITATSRNMNATSGTNLPDNNYSPLRQTRHHVGQRCPPRTFLTRRASANTRISVALGIPHRAAAPQDLQQLAPAAPIASLQSASPASPRASVWE